MVRKTSHRKRLAFTMIELIFAIVIIAISVLSLPMITQITQKGIEGNIVQEAIFAASAELMGASVGYWDERSMLDKDVSHLSRVININNNVECDVATKLRPGHINQLYHRRCIDDTTIHTAQDSVAVIPGINVFDLNDAAALVSGTPAIFTDSDKELEGYKDTYTSSLTVSATNNIKFLESKIYNTKTPPELIVRLKMQSANIGEIDYYKRMF